MLAISFMVLAAAPSAKIVITDVRLFDPSLKEAAAQIQDRLAVELSKLEDYEVLTSADLEAMLGLERQRVLLGCDDNPTCAAEVGAAMGAGWVVAPSLGRSGSKLRLDIKLINASANKVALRTGADTTPDDLLKAVGEAGDQLAETLRAAVSTAHPKAPSAVRVWPLTALVAGSVIAVVGGALLATVPGQRSALQGQITDLTADVALVRQHTLSTESTVGVVLLASGAVVAVAGAVWWVLAPRPQATAWWVMPGLNGVAVGGVF